MAVPSVLTGEGVPDSPTYDDLHAEWLRQQAAAAASRHTPEPPDNDEERRLNAHGEKQLASANLYAVDLLTETAVHSVNGRLRDGCIASEETVRGRFDSVGTMADYLDITDALFGSIDSQLPRAVTAFSGQFRDIAALPGVGQKYEDLGFRFATRSHETAMEHGLEHREQFERENVDATTPGLVLWRLEITEALWVPRASQRSKDLVARMHLAGLHGVVDPQLIVNRGSSWRITAVEEVGADAMLVDAAQII